MFVVVQLFSREGALVTTVRVLPYKSMPEVILWGDRVFVKRESDKKYYEGFCHVVTEKVELREDLDNNGQDETKKIR